MTDQTKSPQTADPTAPIEHAGSAFGWTFWMLNVIEAFERLAYFGIRVVVPVYIASAIEPGGLHLTQIHKGVIYAWWAIFQSWLPMFTGGFADRLGYKNTLAFAISMNVIGYLMMAYFHTYEGFFAGIIVLATGTAFFKPSLQGSIAQKLTKDNASMGWGIFYWVVNIGGFTAPLLTTVILGKPHSAESWRLLFLCCAGYTACNLLVLFTFKDVPSGADKTKSMLTVFAETVENICYFWFRGGTLHPMRSVIGGILTLGGFALFFVPKIGPIGDYQSLIGTFAIVIGVHVVLWLQGGKFTWQLRLPAFILIMSCFWLMMYQLWDLHPNFIEDWIDSSALAAHVPFDSWWEYGDRGLIRVPQQLLLNFNAFLIILLVIPLSWLVRRMRTLSAMLIGMTVATCGILVAGFTSTGGILLVGIALFSFGEMLTGPKKNQYLGLIAPPGKKGLYLGYVNIPIGLGVGIGSVLAGYVYDGFGEKATLALKELGDKPALVERAVRACDWSDTLQMIPDLGKIDRDDALSLAARHEGMTEPQAADYLRTGFRFDTGQVVNLSLLYLAHHPNPEDPEAANAFNKRLLEALAKAEKDGKLKDRPAAQAILASLQENGAFDVKSAPLATIVDFVPKALDRGRPEAFAIVRDRMNSGKADDAKLSHGEVVAALWDEFGADPDVLNNLALEFLAQHTDLLSKAVAGMTFEKPAETMEKRIGIGRTKSFAALSAALGASDAEVSQAIANLGTYSFDNAALSYVAGLPQYRFNAVARRDWADYKPLLKAILDASPEAQKTVDEFYAKHSDLTPGTPKAFEKLTESQSTIQTAFEKVDWLPIPRLAGEFLQLNPYEAKWIIASSLNKSPLTTTQLLWEKYHPQYRVWIPFAAIGFVAIIALAIFGQMAKRWGDMNA